MRHSQVAPEPLPGDDDNVTPFDSSASPAPTPGTSISRKFRYSVSDGLASGPVMNATNTANVMFLRTYIADVVLCSPNDALLEMYGKQQKLRSKVQVTTVNSTVTVTVSTTSS